MSEDRPEVPMPQVCGCFNAQAEASNEFDATIGDLMNNNICPTAIIHGLVWTLLRFSQMAGLPGEVQRAFEALGSSEVHMQDPEQYVQEAEGALDEAPEIIPAPGGSKRVH